MLTAWFSAALLFAISPLAVAVQPPQETAAGAESSAERQLPTSPAVAGDTAGQESALDAPPSEDADAQTAALLATAPDPVDNVKKMFEPPQDVVRLTKDGRLWVDRKGKQVIVDGYVAMSRGMLEMFACPAGTKEHESVVAVLARSRDVHTALLAIGAQTGTPVQWVPKYVSATGQPIRIWVLWYDKQGKLQKTDARKWVVKTGTKKALQEDWVFAGSNFWKDPADGQVYYEADSGDLVCVSNFSSAMLDVPVMSSKDTGALQFSAAEGRVPDEMTPVRLIMIPIPLPSDDPQPRDPAQADPDQPPADKWLTLRDDAKTSAATAKTPAAKTPAAEAAAQ
ncbi:YdjY domain-containing protein [Roseimaritima ulvae]|nr:YdjY domain-containing protein [Roseimaritima ulvae]